MAVDPYFATPQGDCYNPEIKRWQSFEDAPEELLHKHRVAVVPLQAEQILGLLNGTLRIDPDGPQVAADAGFYYFSDTAHGPVDAITKQLDGFEQGKGIWLGIRASNLPPVKEGGMMPKWEVRFIAK